VIDTDINTIEITTFQKDKRKKIDSNKNIAITEAFGGTAIICTIRLVANAAAITSSSDNKKYLVKQAKCDRLRARG